MHDVMLRPGKFRQVRKPLGLQEIRALRRIVSDDDGLETIDFSNDGTAFLVKPAQNTEDGENIFAGIKGYLTSIDRTYEFSIISECVLPNSQAA